MLNKQFFRQMRVAQAGSEATAAAWSSVMRDQAVIVEQVTSLRFAVGIPTAQAVITGGLAGMFALTCTAVIEPTRTWAAGGIISTGAMLIIWLVRLRRWNTLVTQLESVVGVDLGGDEQVSEPVYNSPVKPPVIRVEVTSESGRHTRYGGLPVSEDKLHLLAIGVLRGVAMSESSWTGAGKPFSKREFTCLRDVMLSCGLLRWVNPDARAQGVELSAAGRGLMRHYVSLSPSPTAAENDVEV
jgi:hypothetical protein